MIILDMQEDDLEFLEITNLHHRLSILAHAALLDR